MTVAVAERTELFRELATATATATVTDHGYDYDYGHGYFTYNFGMSPRIPVISLTSDCALFCSCV